MKISRWNTIKSFFVSMGHPRTFLILLSTLIPLLILIGFMRQYTANIPRFDQYRVVPIIVAQYDGTLQLADLFAFSHGHMTVFTFIISLISGHFFSWNLTIEAYANVLFAVLNYALYLLIFYKTQRQLTLVALIPFALMVFSVQQDFNWIIPYGVGWHISIFWFLLALTVLIYQENSNRSFVLAMIFGVFATLSQGNGFLIWPVITLYWLMSRKKIPQLVIWSVIGALISLWFVISSQSTVGDGVAADVEIIQPATLRLWRFIEFTVGYIGSVFTSVYSGYGLAVQVGFLGLLLLAINTLYLYFGLKERESLKYWLPISAYALLVGFMVAVTRLEQHEPERIFLTWYTTSAMLFWIGLTALMILVIAKLWHHPTGFGRVVLYINLIATVFFATRYILANYNDLRHPYAADIIHVQREDCYARYIFQQKTDFDPTCIFPFYTEEINQLAARRLTIFAKREPESILTDDSDVALPVVVETHDIWLNKHIRDYFLQGVDSERIYHIAPVSDVIETIPNPPEQIVMSDNPQALTALEETLLEFSSFWHIARIDHETEATAFWESLSDAGYFPVDVVERNDGMLVSRYIYVPPILENSPQFGEHIRLRSTTDLDSAVRACDVISLNTFWTTEGEIPLEYSGTLALMQNGERLISNDNRLSTVGSNKWEAGKIYADQRQLQVPCDMPAGDYDLTFAIYYYQAPNDRLPMTVDGEMSADGWLTLASVTVSASDE